MFGQIKRQSNKDAEPAANLSYYAICVLDETYNYETLLLTENELRRMRMRAKRNPEDWITLSWVQSAAIWILKTLYLL
tara:strand:- start:651 stop:884 length:234 start_codon:yes stop_codon:yes gene_type:complete